MEMGDYHPKKLSNIDLWVSMIENWGESIKEFNHGCRESKDKVETCVLNMSKYIWRMVNAMKYLNQRIETYNTDKKGPSLGETPSLVRFKGGTNPENISRNWFKNFKKTGKKLPATQLDLSAFFRGFGCNKTGSLVVYGNPFPENCMNIINKAVDGYNYWLSVVFRRTLSH